MHYQSREGRGDRLRIIMGRERPQERLRVAVARRPGRLALGGARRHRRGAGARRPRQERARAPVHGEARPLEDDVVEVAADVEREAGLPEVDAAVHDVDLCAEGVPAYTTSPFEGLVERL